ncbi:MAG: hypothetical protein F4060_02415 [Holophagales bacterium]|nr:hypothetical protein [Holophagales bacterium]MYG30083.1 hypothetical protein [Holophagales bacterium]MYI78771.1 hypothetical protein [Holophagales bacterium]
MIVSMGYQEIVLDSERDGAHSAWDGATVKLLKGSRLAVGPVIQLQSSPLQMIVIVPKPELAEGVFFVQPRSEPPFRFEVNVSTKLHAYLQRKAGELRPTIMTHIVTGCFRLLQHSYSRDSDEDGGWRSDRSLLALSDFLEERGLGHWSDDDFRPEQAATSLYPLTLPEPQEET